MPGIEGLQHKNKSIRIALTDLFIITIEIVNVN
jgi:hypothetical protein